MSGYELGPQVKPPDGMTEVYDKAEHIWRVVPEEDAWEYSNDVMRFTSQPSYEQGER